MAKEFKSEVIKVYDSESAKKVSIIKWGDNNPTVDIRRFTSEGVPLKGISLAPDEIDEIISAMQSAKKDIKKYSPYKDEPMVDERETINIMDTLRTAPSIVDNRTLGHVTVDSLVVVKLTPYIKKRIKRLMEG